MGLSVDPWTRGEAMRALTSIPVVRYAQFPVVPRRLGEGSSRPEGDLQVRRNEGLESERKRSSAAGAGSARSGRTFKLGRSGTLPDGTPREGWRGLPIRNAIQRACILRGRAAKRDNKLSHSKSLLLWSIRFRAWAPKSSNRVPEAATKSFTVREITRYRRAFPKHLAVSAVDEWTASPLRKNSLIATETRRKMTIIRNSRADLKAPVIAQAISPPGTGVTPGKEEEAAPMEHIDRREVLLGSGAASGALLLGRGFASAAEIREQLIPGPISRRRCRRRRRRW